MYIIEDAPYANTSTFQNQFEKRLSRCDLQVSSSLPGKTLPEPSERTTEQLKKLDKFVGSVYDELSIIDNKVGSLTQISSVLLALSGLSVSSLFEAKPDSNISPTIFVIQDYLTTFSLIFLSLAIVLALSVIWLHWLPETDAAAPENRLRRLLKVRNKRTRRYRASWYFTFLGAILAFANLLIEAQFS